MSRLLARLLALVCLIGVSPVARAAAAPSAITQREVESVEARSIDRAPAPSFAIDRPATSARTRVVGIARLFITHRALLI